VLVADGASSYYLGVTLMLGTLPETQRAAVTVVVFLGSFFITLAIGRLLKRRAGVRLGLLFRLFCLALAFYVAIWIYGVPLQWRTHAAAIVALLSTAFIVALVNRYVWDLYFEKKRQTPIPHFLREVVAGLIFLIALLLVLWYGYHAERWLTGLLAGSGVAAIILGFAGQNLFGSIIAGMSLQVNRPYRVGDWLQVGERFAEVMEINWRSTRLRTNDWIYLDIPNNEMVRQTIVNLHYPTQLHAMRIRVPVDYNVPPNSAKDALFRAASRVEGVVKDPPVRVFLVDFADYAATYEVKYHMLNHAAINEVSDAIRTNIWYELKRQRIKIPFPIRTLQLERPIPPLLQQGHAEARAILQRDRLFQCLPDPHLDNLLKNSKLDHFGRGEAIIEEGTEGESMFVLLRGTAHVTVTKNRTSVRVGGLRPGDCFGEMSLLTGERRSATVRADRDCYVMEIGKPVMAEVLRDSPQCLEQLSDLLARRKMENEGILKDTAIPADNAEKAQAYRASFLKRLRAVFDL
jgi:small-conductance mechanosensitive channel/CRP-like cAMP-binding protein